jgi:hypothetical protein
MRDAYVAHVDAIGRCEGLDGVTAISSCDVYELAGAMIRSITSDAAEVQL